mgnify:CR=1 FL=1
MNQKFFCEKIKTLTLIAPRRVLLKKLREALVLIERTDAKERHRLLGRLKTIFITNKIGYTNEFFMPEKLWFANKSLILKNTTVWIASLIVHEAFHAAQFKKGRYIMPLAKLEKPALKKQAQFLKKLNRADLVQDLKTAVKHEYRRKMQNDKASFAHFRKLLTLLGKKELILKKLQNFQV